MAKAVLRETVILDTGIVYALADRRDKWHRPSVKYVEGFKGRFVLPCTVVPEACYLINTYLGKQAEASFIQALLGREMTVEHLIHADMARIHEVLETYADANVGLVDASVVAVAERLGVSSILTTDRRHFSIIRPKHCSRFKLLPE